MSEHQHSKRVADAAKNNWVDQFAPESTKPYLRLMRADRPIGVWLLMWPCWWSTAFASLANGDPIPNVWHLTLFAIGSFAMRGAGCTYNDIIDRDIDAQVARTQSRPLPSGAISVNGAKLFMVILCLLGLAVLLQFNSFAILLGIASLIPVAIYPFMKRLISWPQLFLGLAFSWGALMGWAATFGALSQAPILLYLGTIAWTMAYDTIYALQDKEDDAMLGLGSTALAFEGYTKTAVSILYALSILLFGAAAIYANAGTVFFAGLALGAIHLTWQVATLNTEDPSNCLKRFRSNRDFGAIIFAAIVADMTASSLI